MSNPVRRRRVFYIPGYDPFPARRYRELYRTESALQAKISGYQIEMTERAREDGYGWGVAAQMEGQTSRADIEVLVWSDIVRKSMPDTIWATYKQLFRTSWTYLSSDALRRMMWLRKGPVIAALYPVGMLLLQLVVACLIPSILLSIVSGIGSSINSSMGIDWPIWLQGGWAWMTWVAGWGLFMAGAALILRWFKSQDHRLYAYYLMHDYAYSASLKGATPPDLQDRMDAFRGVIATALTDEVDEVLVVGHSSGAHLAISILSDLIRNGSVPANGPKLALLTLGEVVPMITFLPRGGQLRADLAFLSQREEIFWLDVTAPGDGCCFALCDPVAVSGMASESQKWPIVMSAAFTMSLSEETWSKLRWRFFRLHFQYLCAFDKPRDYDYFKITAGPQTLADRYVDRESSSSRIDVAASKYTSKAA
ncbi:hypothetical protein AAD018_007175 [Aestuariibius insulae]|uniref:hypothetical protein n=1 Tax=Aestuariibius insulae TaxID=2058287 RepID=UPI00345EF4FE